MPRPKSPGGDWATIPVRIRQGDLDRIDAARGDRNRSEWMRGVALAALEQPEVAAMAAFEASLPEPPQDRPAPARAPKRRGRTATRRIVAEGQAERAAAVPEPPVGAVVPPKFKRCTHPGKRVVGGYCNECDHLILAGGAWA